MQNGSDHSLQFLQYMKPHFRPLLRPASCPYAQYNTQRYHIISYHIPQKCCCMHSPWTTVTTSPCGCRRTLCQLRMPTALDWASGLVTHTSTLWSMNWTSPSSRKCAGIKTEKPCGCNPPLPFLTDRGREPHAFLLASGPFPASSSRSHPPL